MLLKNYFYIPLNALERDRLTYILQKILIIFDFLSRFRNELARVMAHGVLHCIGYADKSIEDVQLMREKEDYYLSKLDLA